MAVAVGWAVGFPGFDGDVGTGFCAEVEARVAPTPMHTSRQAVTLDNLFRLFIKIPSSVLCMKASNLGFLGRGRTGTAHYTTTVLISEFRVPAERPAEIAIRTV